MVINNNDTNIIQEYLNKLNEIERDGLIKGSEELKTKISKNMAYNICDKVYEVKNCAVPNEKDIQEKIINLMEEIIDEYYKEVHSYVSIENGKITSSISNMENNNVEVDEEMLKEGLSKPLQYFEIKENEEIINKMITRINSHIAFRNQNNPEYYNKKNEIENYVRQEITKKMPIFKEEMDQIYDVTLKKLNDEKFDMLEYITNFETKGKKNITLASSQFEGLEPVFDVPEEYESENAKRFM